MQLALDTTKKYALALAGGGAKGAYEVGVWNALAQAGIRFEAVSGTSIGAMNAAFVATDELERAKKIWLSLTYSKVILADPTILDKLTKKDFTDLDLRKAADFLANTVRSRGLDISPMRETMREVIDENAVRNSPIDYYIVTCSVDDLKELELRAKDMEDGELYDMLLASAYLPVFRNEPLRGKRYLDGGFMDVLPVHVLVENGYKDIIAVSCNAIGYKRPVDLPEDVNVWEVEPRTDIGNVLEFDPKQSAENLKIGYFDGLRLLYGLQGKKYYIDHTYSEETSYSLLVTYAREFLKATGRDLSLREINEKVLPRVAARSKSTEYNYSDLLISALEVAASEAKIDPYRVYTEDELIPEVLSRYPVSEGVIPRGLQSRLLALLDDDWRLT
ncbi:MAG: patatin-like phospholipase family protein [Oscillospiraceae bacterium]|nr:patatin-like phospholipase family protein [Oscillospiraceae bacterium]